MGIGGVIVAVILVTLWPSVSPLAIDTQLPKCSVDVRKGGWSGKVSPLARSVNDRSCEWSSVATVPSQIVVANIVRGRRGTLTLTVDDNVTSIVSSDIDRLSARRSMRLVWKDDPSSEAVESFVLTYAVFESDTCRAIDTDDVVIVDDDDGATSGGSESIEVGSKVRFACASAPVHSFVEAECRFNLELDGSRPLRPSWSHSPPSNCTGCGSTEPVRVRLATNGSQVLSHDGSRTSSIEGGDNDECLWELEATDKDAIVRVNIEWLRAGPNVVDDDHDDVDDHRRHPWLEVYDGDRTEARLLRRFYRGLEDGGATSFTSLHSKMIVAIVTTTPSTNSTNFSSSSYDLYAHFVSEAPPPRCRPSMLSPPVDGDVRGSEMPIDPSSSSSDSLVAIFTCNNGYRLVGGSERSECTTSGSWSSTVPVCQPEEEVVVAKGPDKTLAKTPKPRYNKISRPRPQSTEEKGYEKVTAKEEVAVKSPDPEDGDVDTEASEPPPEEEEAQPPSSGEPDVDWRSGSGQPDGDYENTLTDYSEMDDYHERQLFKDDDHDEKEAEEDVDMVGGGDGGEANRLPIMAIVLSITLPLLACTVVAVSCVVYRRLYPVRMGPGRRFETFENPIYGRRATKRSASTPGNGTTPVASPVHLAQSPAELERLTTANVDVTI